jgi:hypothetical protein
MGQVTTLSKLFLLHTRMTAIGVSVPSSNSSSGFGGSGDGGNGSSSTRRARSSGGSYYWRQPRKLLGVPVDAWGGTQVAALGLTPHAAAAAVAELEHAGFSEYEDEYAVTSSSSSSNNSRTSGSLQASMVWPWSLPGMQVLQQRLQALPIGSQQDQPRQMDQHSGPLQQQQQQQDLRHQRLLKHFDNEHLHAVWDEVLGSRHHRLLREVGRWNSSVTNNSSSSSSGSSSSREGGRHDAFSGDRGRNWRSGMDAARRMSEYDDGDNSGYSDYPSSSSSRSSSSGSKPDASSGSSSSSGFGPDGSSGSSSDDDGIPDQAPSTAAAMAANTNAAALEMWSWGNHSSYAAGASGGSSNGAAAGDDSSGRVYDPAMNDGMPCWLALARQNAPPPYDPTRLMQPDQGSQRLLSKLQQSAIT